LNSFNKIYKFLIIVIQKKLQNYIKSPQTRINTGFLTKKSAKKTMKKITKSSKKITFWPFFAIFDHFLPQNLASQKIAFFKNY